MLTNDKNCLQNINYLKFLINYSKIYPYFDSIIWTDFELNSEYILTKSTKEAFLIRKSVDT
jgi:hypothetical protein